MWLSCSESSALLDLLVCLPAVNKGQRCCPLPLGERTCEELWESSPEVGKGVLEVLESSQVDLDRKAVWWCSIHRFHVGRVYGRWLNYTAEGMCGHKNQT